MNAHFVNLWVLYLVWLVPLAALLWHAAEARRSARLDALVANPMRGRLSPPAARARGIWQTSLLSAGMTLALAAAARPQWGVREEIVFQRGRDVLILLDVSRSMLAADVHPNRLARAKADLMDVIRELKGDRIGLMAFRRKAQLLCPLTTDYAYFAQALDAAGPWSAPRGETDIGDAIEKALDSMSDGSSSAHQAIILVSDGEDLSGRALDAAKKAGELGVAVFTVGLGDRNGARIPDPDGKRSYASYRGEEVVTKLHNETLFAIAEATGGTYVPLEITSTASTTLGTIYRNHLRKVAAREMEETLERRRVERFHLFLLPAVALMIGALFLSRGRLAAAAPAPAGGAPPEKAADQPRLKNMDPPGRPPKVPQVLALLFAFAALSASAPAGVQSTNAPSGISNPESRISNPESRIPNPESRIPNPESQPPGRSGAWRARRLYAIGRYSDAADAYLAAAPGLTGAAARACRFNAAIAMYRAGRYDESEALFRDLSLSEPDRRRADSLSGLGAALAADRPAAKDDAEAADRRFGKLMQAAESFREAAALGNGPDGTMEDFGSVLAEVPSAAEAARIETLNRRYGSSTPDAIAMEMLAEQRDIAGRSAEAFTNDSPDQIRMLEAIAERQKANAHRWIPLKGKLLQALEAAGAKDEQARKTAAELQQTVEVARDAMASASRQLRDLDPAAQATAARCEATMYMMWKAVAPFAPILREDLRRQTNSAALCASGEHVRGRPDQTEARDLTGLFAERFSGMVPEGGLPAQPQQQKPDGSAPATNAPPLISAENRAKILDLSARTGEQQQAALRAIDAANAPDLSAAQKEAERLLREIMDLLPKDTKSDDGKQQEQQKQESEDRQKQDGQQQQPEQQQTAQEDQEQKEPEQKQDEREEVPENVREMMQKALQRESEHEEELRRRMETIPMAPHERDW